MRALGLLALGFALVSGCAGSESDHPTDSTVVVAPALEPPPGVDEELSREQVLAIAQGEADPKYHTYFIAHKDSGLKKGDSFPKDLAGKKFTFGSRSSTSGRLMPEYFIQQNSHKSPREFFGAEPPIPTVYSG